VIFITSFRSAIEQQCKRGRRTQQSRKQALKGGMT
jgi:hypothetical protein